MLEDKKCYKCAYCITKPGNSKKEMGKWCYNHEVIQKITNVSNVQAEQCEYFKPSTQYIDDIYISEGARFISQKVNEKTPKKQMAKKLNIQCTLSDIRSEAYNSRTNPPTRESDTSGITEGSVEHQCDKCFYCNNLFIGGVKVMWCFHKKISKQLHNVSEGLKCSKYIRQRLPADIEIDKFSGKPHIERRKKVKKLAETYRFAYRIVDNVVYIASRYDHWIIALSEGKEYLFHRNRKQNTGTEYHLQKIYENLPRTIFNIFSEINTHDEYVLSTRIFGKCNTFTQSMETNSSERSEGQNTLAENDENVCSQAL